MQYCVHPSDHCDPEGPEGCGPHCTVGSSSTDGVRGFRVKTPHLRPNCAVAYPSLVGLKLSKEVKEELDELEDKNEETEQNTKTLIQADAHVSTT